MGKILQQFSAIWQKLGINQKATIIVMMVALVVGISALVYVARMPSYELLYSGLTQEDTAKVVDYLRGAKISYRVTDGGQTVMVAEGRKYDVMSKLVSQNITPSSRGRGLGGITPNSLVATRTQQELMARHALQTELANVISRLEPVVWAEVQIAAGKQEVFADQDIKATSAVTIKLRGGQTLSSLQIAGITRLVANSIQGLEAQDVSINDEHGNLLTRQRRGDEIESASARQEYQRSMEQYLANKAQAILVRSLGKGKSEVRVSVELAMDAKSEEIESYDLDGKYATTEKTTTTTTPGNGTAGMATSEDTTANYIAPLTKKKLKVTPGEITRLDIAMLVDPNYQVPKKDEDGKLIPLKDEKGNDIMRNGEPVYELESRTYASEELTKLGELVKYAVGFSEERKDKFTLHAMAFHSDQPGDSGGGAGEKGSARGGEGTILKMARHGSPIAAALLFVAFAMVALRKIGKMKPVTQDPIYASVGSGDEGGVDASSDQGDSSPGAGIVSSSVQKKLRNRVKDIMAKDPVTAARLLQGWLEQEK